LVSKIFYDNTNYRLRGWRKLQQLIEKVISNEKKISGDLNLIITDDNSLKKINKEFLQHNYFTDVISFNCSDNKTISGEIYISIETVKLNSINYNVSLENELRRVIIHGILHLCGYDDRTASERKNMKRMEDYWLSNY
jgi:probable rRNA maturation factor